jgi:lysozyme
MSYLDIVRAQLRIDEGVKNFPYRDTVGKLTVGCGRNLDDVGLSQDEINYLLDNDILRAEIEARKLIPSFDRLSPNRKAVVVNMAFNLGATRLAGFRNFRAAVEAGAWEQAAAEMIDSAWRHQVGDRALRLSMQMREG